jgi:two-component system cell cycle response regulator
MSSAAKYKILVVDDSAVYRKLIEQVLSGSGYSLSFARSGSEALQSYRENPPSIVITDWLMPDLSGLELCRLIRADQSDGYAYVIVMTSNTEENEIVEGLDAGADDYVVKPFNPREMLARIRAGCRIVDLHVRLKRKSEQLEEVARTDSLTGLPNRRAIEEWTRKQIKGAARHGFPLWAVLADIDSFKGVNDTFGHEAGDAVLRGFGDILKRATRVSDMCARFGGDEFLLAISHVGATDVETAINRMREQFAALSFPFAGQCVSITATFGAASVQCCEPKEFATLLRRADEMLYEAKRAGRSCVRVSKWE